jgi:DNA gyrase subunit A
VENKPKVLNLKQILECYVSHQKDVVTRRTRFELAKAKERAHILEGLKIALDHLDEVIHTIRNSANAEIAKASLMEKFSLSDRQSQAILDMRLQRLTGLERKKIDDEYIDVLQTIDYLESVLADEKKVLDIIKKDLNEKADKFGDNRRTEIVNDTGDMDVLDLIADEEIVITLSNQGYIKRQTPDNFRKQQRGGIGKKGGSGKKEDDFTQYLFLATTHNYILFFTNKGQVYTLRGYQIPEAGRTAKGSAIINLLQLSPGEKITAVINVSEFEENRYLFMATDKGTVKRCKLTDFSFVRRSGLKAIVLNEDEELIGVRMTDGNASILMATRDGMAIHFSEEDVRCMGRSAHGVRGINLGRHDTVVAMDYAYDPESEVLTVTENGQGKRTKLSEYTKQTRGGKGRINYKLTPKTGDVVGMTVVNPKDELYIITAAGIVIRMDVDQLRKLGRNTQGVNVITLREGDKVTSIAAVESEEGIVKE